MQEEHFLSVLQLGLFQTTVGPFFNLFIYFSSPLHGPYVSSSRNVQVGKKKTNKFFIQFQISWTSDIFCVWRSGLLLSLLFGSEESGFCSAKETGTDEQQCHK